MNLIKKIKEDHKAMEIEFSEIEMIIEDEVINYSNLVHTLKKIFDTWDGHEEMEEMAFDVLRKEGIDIPIQKILTDHKTLKPHKEKIKRAINSGNDALIKEILNTDGRDILQKFRDHVQIEDEILYRINVNDISSEGLEKLGF